MTSRRGRGQACPPRGRRACPCESRGTQGKSSIFAPISKSKFVSSCPCGHKSIMQNKANQNQFRNKSGASICPGGSEGFAPEDGIKRVKNRVVFDKLVNLGPFLNDIRRSLPGVEGKTYRPQLSGRRPLPCRRRQVVLPTGAGRIWRWRNANQVRSFDNGFLGPRTPVEFRAGMSVPAVFGLRHRALAASQGSA